MLSNTKYRINNMAKDLNLKSKDLVDMLTDKGFTGRTHMAVMEANDYSVLLNELTNAKQITSINDYLDGKVVIETPKPVEEQQPKEEAKKEEPAKADKVEAKPIANTESKQDAKQVQNQQNRPNNANRNDAPNRPKSQQQFTRPVQAQPQKSKVQKQKPQQNQYKPGSSIIEGQQNIEIISSDASTRTRGTTKTVDTRSSSVDLSRYDDKAEKLVPEAAKDVAGEKQKLKKQDRRDSSPKGRDNNSFRNNREANRGRDAKVAGRDMAARRGNDRERAAMEKIKRQELEKAKHAQLQITIPDSISVGELASRLKVAASEVVKKLMMLGVMASINQNIDYDTAFLIADEMGAAVTKEVVVTIEEKLFSEEEDSEENLVERAPIVVVMGHVDHGKTSLLDKIRHANVTAGEAGGITQHIGAYRVNINNKDITFLDTPGHEAFTAMRARGAKSTDIAILVVAADDGIMPQTIEAINHAKDANLDIIVAINKMDKPQADPENIKSELTKYELIPEEWGGDVMCVPVSALTGKGINELLEDVLIIAEMKEFKANPNRRAKGVIIESRLDKGRGPVATVLVQNGTLHQGDVVIAGTSVGRVRNMSNENGRTLKEAGPSVPVEIFGLDEVPAAGDEFNAVEDERMARELAEQRRNAQREAEFKANSTVNLDDLFAQINSGVKELKIIVKADVAGSAEAVKASLEKISNEEVKVKIIHTGIGGITEGDVTFAAASNAIIVGFNVRPDKNAIDSAERQKVDVRTYRIIYECIEEIEAAIKGMLAPTYKESILGHAEVRQTIHVPNVGTIAGSYVQDGLIKRSAKIRVLRDGIVIFEDKISSLRRFKDDKSEVAQGYECGIGLDRFNDIRVGDVLEAFEMVEVAR
ncbi:MAG: translation initiation factor IF-2 [Clostridia bacterium]|nr:translation initiation factor IF-2 [Clostridia bacterium]